MDEPGEKPPGITRPPESSEPMPMTEEEIIKYLLVNGVKRLHNFIPKKPMLCVIPDEVRYDANSYARRPRDRSPCIARIHKPLHIDREGQNVTLENGGIVEYFAIDKSGEPKRLRASNNRVSYKVRANGLFEDSKLFPRLIVEPKVKPE